MDPDDNPFARRLPGDAIMTLTGDVNIQDRPDPKSAFARVADLLGRADVLFGQLECPLHPSTTAQGVPDIPHKPNWRHADPRMVEGLEHAGFTAMSLASNVMFPRDVGPATAAVLDRAGIAHCGAGSTLAEARAPAIVTRAGLRFGFLGYTSVFWPYGHAAADAAPGCATIKAHTAYGPGPRALEMPGAAPIVTTWPDRDELAAMEADVRALRARADIVVVTCHWGVSSSHTTADYQRAIARAALAAGADLVFGHHPHVVQGVELFDGKPAFYSLGNFAFDWARMRGRYREGLAIECLVRSRKIAAWRCVMVRRDEANDIAPLDARTAEGRALAATFAELSAEFGTGIVVRDGFLVPDGR